MFLQELPFAVRCIVLMAVGGAVGSLINLAIYRLPLYSKRNISPWSAASDGQPRRNWSDRIPVIGWLLLRRESAQLGRGFWIRPMLIELGVIIWLVWFYHWETGGGLFGQAMASVSKEQQEFVAWWTHTWFLMHAVLIALMIVATFIDLDEQTIPDWITVPGTLFALAMVVAAPSARLPLVVNELLRIKLQPLTFTTPGPAVQWQQSPWGLACAIGIILIWCFALIPKWATTRRGLLSGIWLMWVSILNPPRKTSARIPQRARHMRIETKLFLIMAVAGSVLAVAVWSSGGERWQALFDSLLGLAMGGGVVWAVRIVAGGALGVEAMGFGDVTLMCMIGAFLGWQPALLIFVMAPFASLLVIVAIMLSGGDNQIAFGPYLCIATVFLILGWNWIWNQWAAPGIFNFGAQFGFGPEFVLVILAICLVLMPLMLFGIRIVRGD